MISKILFPEFRQELLRMLEKDQALISSEKSSKYKSTSKRHGGRLKEILAVIELPSIKNLGKDGAKAAWLIAQHADHDQRFQKSFLKLMEEIYQKDKNDVYYQGIPYLIDRIQVQTLGYQTYGTQLHKDKFGKLTPYRIKNPQSVNKRRARYSLGSYESYLQDIEAAYEKSTSTK